MRRSLLALALSMPLISQPTLFDSFWNLLSAVWAESTTDEGCIGDPDGRCAPAPQPQSDAGCIGDPNGGPQCSS